MTPPDACNSATPCTTRGSNVEPLRTHLDFESRSLVDIKLGEHAYARHFSTSPLMLTIGTAPKGVRPVFETLDFFKVPGYAQAVYPACKGGLQASGFKVPCPPAIVAAIERGDIFVAHNARFEQGLYHYICVSLWGWPPITRWSCTAARSRYFGIRASLEGSASDLEVITQKDERGKQFINDFCKPRKYQGAKYLGIVKELWYEPHENPAGWQIGLEYCEIDGYAESEVDSVLPDLPPFEQWSWEWDFLINTRGVPIDMKSVDRAIMYTDHFTNAAVKRFKEITDLRPTQRDRVLEYLQQREEIENLGDLRSKTLRRLVQGEFPPELQEAIQIRLDTSGASVKKLQKMRECADPHDGMARGGHLWHGAGTGRWTHKRIQNGNMKRSDKEKLARMFAYLERDEFWPVGHNGGPPLDEPDPFGLFKAAEDGLQAVVKPPWVDAAEWRFMNPLADLGVSMKGFIKATPDRELIDVDYSQIEARVLAWLARCNWLLDAFRNKEDPYVKFAAEHMYKVNYADCFVDVNGKREVAKHFKRQRQVSKSAVLGAGYGLGAPQFVEYCDNSDLIISLTESKETIDAYRGAHPEIVALWGRFEQAAIMAVANPGQVYAIGGTGVKFYTWHIDTERYWLVREDPSGSCGYYYRPKLEVVQRWGRTVEQLTYRKEWNGKSYREQTYGGKLVQNACEKIARDILCVGGRNAERAGYPSIMLVHDSNVTMPLKGHGSPEELRSLMLKREDWFGDIPLEAEATRLARYA